MKGTIFAVALNHRSQLDAWREAFQQAPYKTPPKTAVWFIKPRNTVIGDGESIPYPQGETVQSGATVALIDALAVLKKRGALKGNPLKQMVAAVSVGIYQGVPVLDLDYLEDSAAETDLNVVMTDAGGFIEVQGTAEGAPFRPAELNAMLELAQQGMQELFELQRAALAE